MSQRLSSDDTLPVYMDDIETRVLGCLMEKAVLTPRHYPLTMNGLRNACNQKTGRNPVVSWHEHILHGALERLTRRGLVRDVEGGRARKVEHCVEAAFGLEADGIAVLTVLMLAGPADTSELLEPASRLHPFADEVAVRATLVQLLQRKPDALAAALPLAEGETAQRFRHCLTHSDEQPAKVQPAPAPAALSIAERTQRMEKEIQWVQGELLSIKDLLAADLE